MSNFSLRNIPTDLLVQLKREAKRLNISVNALILQMIERGFGVTQKKIVYHDLDHLAGSWSPTDEKNFEENTQYFQRK
jgi:hypothetical protein